jgi:hypothetical protein
MFVVPAAIPVTTPPVDTVATPGVLLLHTPFGTVFAKLVVSVGHTVLVPVIAAGAVFTVTVRMSRHPVEVNVNVMFAFPPDTPVTTPDALTEAIDGEPLTHVPAPDALVCVLVPSWHIVSAPADTAGGAITVTVTKVKTEVQLLEIVQVIFAVPAATPVTTPVEAFTVAFVPSLLDHTFEEIPPLGVV